MYALLGVLGTAVVCVLAFVLTLGDPGGQEHPAALTPFAADGKAIVRGKFIQRLRPAVSLQVGRRSDHYALVVRQLDADQARIGQ